MRKCLGVGLLLTLVATLAACGASKGPVGSVASNKAAGSSKPYPELRWGLITFPGVLDWNRNVWANLVSVESLAVNNLMEFESNGKVKPGLASSVEQPNPTTYVYHLKSVKFSDGKSLTAADVVFSLSRNLHGKEVWDKPYWEDVASISERDSSTVVIKLKQPNAVFQDIVAFSGEVIEKAAAEKTSEKELGTPGHLLIGTGPWMFDSYKPEVSVQLSRNPYWTGPSQPAQRITVDLFKTEASMALALRSGAIDGTFNFTAPKVFANIPGVRSLTTSGTSIVFASANTRTPPFNDVHVRRALAYATDTKGMVDALYPHGEAIEDPTIMPASLFSDLGSQSQVNAVLGALPKYEFNLAKAKEELAKSAYPRGFTTEIQVEQVEAALVSCAEILSSDLAKVGITAKVREVPPADAASVLLGGKSKLVLNTYYAVYPDPEGIMATMLAPSQIDPPGSGLNTANYRNTEVDRLLPESLKTTNTTKRLQMIGKLLGIVGSEAPFWPLYSHATFGALSEKYVLPTFSEWMSQWVPWALDVKQAS